MADDEYDPNALDDAEAEDEEYQSWEATKERAIALINADQSMLEKLCVEGDEKSYLAWAVEIVTGVLQSRIRNSPNDEIGVVFYGTVARSESEDMRPFDHVYEYIKMDSPDAATIQRLSKFREEEFRGSPGCDDAAATPGRAADALKHGLWACWDILQRPGGGRSSKTVWVFTNNQDPTADAGANARHMREQIFMRAQELGSQAVLVDVLPLVQLSDPGSFDYGLFWRPLLGECRSAAQGVAGQVASDGQEAAEEMDEQAEQVETKLSRVQGLGLHSTQRKRPLASLHWTLAPGFTIAVQLFALVQPQKKPSHIYVTADSHEQVSKSNALIDQDTGALLPAVNHVSFAPKISNRENTDKFPKVIVTAAESKELKALRPKGLTLLGFKPMSALANHHQLSPSRFVYPDERSLRGSTAAFAALHSACLMKGTGAERGIELGIQKAEHLRQAKREAMQEVPPGFHLITLPFKDNLRAPEREAALGDRVKGTQGLPRATEDQVAAAEALVKAISLGEEEPFSTADIANPHLARHFEVLECLALGQQPPPIEEFEDESAPDITSIDAHRATLDAFKLAVWGSVEGPAQPVKKAAAKRKAPDSTTQVEFKEWLPAHSRLLMRQSQLPQMSEGELRTWLGIYGASIKMFHSAMPEDAADVNFGTWKVAVLDLLHQV
eukprot:gene4952-5193_t